MPTENPFTDSSLCVVGNINRDIKTTPLDTGGHLFTDGESPVAAIAETIGGGGANSAFTAAALGARTTFLGKTGADGLGERLVRTLKQHGITDCLARDPGHPSGTSIALNYTSGHRHFLSSLPASRALAFADLNLAALPGHNHLLRADVWFSDEMLFGGNERLFRAARDAGLAVSVDLNWDPHWGHASAAEIEARKQALRASLPWVNLAHGNTRELMEFTGAPDLDQALGRLTACGVEAVVVHLGERGAGYYRQGALIVEPPAPGARVVTTTGTGDVLSVCMILLHGCVEMPVPERLCVANAVVAQFMAGERQFIPTLAD